MEGGCISQCYNIYYHLFTEICFPTEAFKVCIHPPQPPLGTPVRWWQQRVGSLHPTLPSQSLIHRSEGRAQHPGQKAGAGGVLACYVPVSPTMCESTLLFPLSKHAAKKQRQHIIGALPCACMDPFLIINEHFQTGIYKCKNYRKMVILACSGKQ